MVKFVQKAIVRGLRKVSKGGQNGLKIGVFCRKGEKGRKRQKIVKKCQILAKNGDFWPFLKKFKKKF